MVIKFDLRTFSEDDVLVFEDLIPVRDPYMDIETVIAGIEQ